MNPERWQQIEKLYNSALEVETDRREPFLKEACAGDESLRKEVEQLLASQPRIERFIESPALEVAAKALAKEQGNVPANDLIGRTISHYRVTEKIGQGGMGEVFLAEDTSLHRKVALKFLPPEMQQDPVAHKRFLREARSAAALDNPYICSIHEVSEFEGKDFIVMEYVDGQTLREKLRRGRMPLNQALQIATEVADALQAAHGKGIIHRDLKPSNIMLTKTGHAKVMDFGLAKQVIPPGGIESQEESVSAMTRTGMMLGTLAYMSPEQLRGDAVDAQSDIFSFGVVLYEMLTGAHPFQKESPMDTGSAILHQEPKPVSAMTQGIPPDLDKLIGRCLRKDLVRRFRHMDDVKVELEDLRQESDSQSLVVAPATVRHTRRTWWAASIGIVLLAAGTWIWRDRMGSELLPPKVVTLTSDAGDETNPTFSPDGNKVAFEWYKPELDHADIYVKAVGETHALRLTYDPAGSHGPAWSPDDRNIAFSRGGPPEKTGVYLVSPLGGPERKISDFPSFGQLSWTPDGKFLAAARSRPAETKGEDPSGIYLVPVEEGLEHRITSPKAPTIDFSPSVSPDGKILAFARCPALPHCDVYCQPLGPDGSAQGEARRITWQNSDIGSISWCRDGESVIYGTWSVSGWNSHLWRAWVNSDNSPLRLEFAGPRAGMPAVAPLKNRLAYAASRIYACNICRLQLGGVPESFIVSSLRDAEPAFSPDGKKILFASSRAGETADIWVSDADGSNPVQLTHEAGNAGTPCWSPDGRLIVFDLHAPDGSASLYTVNPTGGRPRRLTPPEIEAVMGSWSPDGKWMYFTSNRSGRREIWRMPATGGGAQQITEHGADTARVSVDGKTIYFTKGSSEVLDLMSKGSELFAIPSAGGEERKITDSVAYHALTVTKYGIYYIRRGQKGRPDDLRLLDLLTLKSRTLSLLEGNIDEGLTVSPDGKIILYSRRRESNADLMLIENFR